MSEVQTAPEGPLSIDAAVALLAEPPKEEEQQQEQAPQPEVKAEPEAPPPNPEEAPTPEEIAAAEALEAEAEGEEEPEVDLPPIDPPQSWDKEAKEEFKTYPREAQERIAKREVDRDKAIAKAVQQASEASKAIQALSQRTEELASQVLTDFERKWGKGEEGNVDWQRLAYEQPENYQAYRAQFEAERLAVKQAKTEASQQAELAHRVFLAEQAQKLPDLAPELADPEKGQERRAKAFEFLHEQGFTPEDTQRISALELSIAFDAMRWRESQQKAKEMAAVPRKQPLAAPKALGPKAASTPSKGRELQGLETKLTQRGTIDDAVNLLMAREQMGKRRT